MNKEEIIWNKKIKLVKILNQEKYDEAINLMMENLDNLDIQFCEMFIHGFDVTLSKKLPDKLINKIDSLYDNINFIERYRWGIIKGIIKGDIKLKNE